MGIAAPPLTVTADERRALIAWEKAHKTPQAVGIRVRIVLAAAEGMANQQIAQKAGVTRATVIAARRRFEEGGPEALTKVSPGRGRPASISAAKVAQIVYDTLHTKPQAAIHWNCRAMAKKHGVSKNTIQRIWDSNGLRVLNVSSQTRPRVSQGCVPPSHR